MIAKHDLKITTLVENTAQTQGLLGEHGLSIMVEAPGTRILFDTGASPHAIIHNATRLGVDPRHLDAIVLSHGHWDHTGGLEAILSIQDTRVDIITHPGIWATKGMLTESHGFVYAGIQYNREHLESLGARFLHATDPVWITDDIVFSGEESLTTDFEQVDPTLACKNPDGSIEPDPVLDNASLCIKTESGLVVVLGCAHRGMVNSVCNAIRITGVDQVHMVIGGTHLMQASEQRIAKTIEALKQLGVTHVGCSHCTGFNASAALQQAWKGCFFHNHCGTVMTV